ncbi:MAG: sulfur carrier protein ThiS [Chloroflexi bacterium]|nr:sulfur carrier protein ThiS [Chloroflexota bacterium]
MVTLTVNGKQREIDGPMALIEFLVANKIEPRLIVIEYNGEIIKRERWDEIALKAGDKLEIVHMVAGG